MSADGTRRGRVARATAVAASGLAVVALAVGAAALPAVLPTVAPTLLTEGPGRTGATVVAPTVDLDPVAVRYACASGPSATMGEAVVVDPAAAAADTTVHAARLTVTVPRAATGGDGEAPAAAATLDGEQLAASGDIRVRGDAAERAATLTAQPAEVTGARDSTVSALAAGATVAAAGAGDLRGLVAWPCAAPRDVSWLVGGSTRVGASTEVTLTNIGATPATVSITVWGSLGPLVAPTAQNITVAPGRATEVLLEGAVAPDPAIALRVDVRGGAVAVRAQDLSLDGLVPAGVSAVPAAADPATELVVPAVAPTAANPATVRLVNPREADATITLTLVGEGGARRPHPEPVVVPAQSVLDVPLEPTDGVWALHLAADAPVTAAVALARTGTPSLLDPTTPPVDRAWAPATPPRRAAVWALPRTGPSQAARLALYSASGATVTVTPYTETGAATGAREVALGAGGVASVDLPAQAVAVAMTADAPVAAAALLTAAAADGELIEVLPGTPDPHTDRSVRVALR